MLTKDVLIQQLMNKKRGNELTHHDRMIDNNLNYGPVSKGQARLLFLNELDDQNTAYNMPCLLKIAGALNIEALEKAFNEVIIRQDVFRTQFLKVAGQYYQKIVPIPRLKVIEIKTKTTHDAITACTKETMIPFNLSSPPLLRVIYYKITARKGLLYILLHHIISDSWSIQLLLKEVTTLYKNINYELMTPLHHLNKNYISICNDTNTRFNQDIQNISKKYWLETLKDLPELIELPTDNCRPNIQSNCGSIYRFTINNTLSLKIKEFCKNHNTSEFTFWLSIYNILIAKYTSHMDFCIACPIANRKSIDEENLIGFFVNTLVLRNAVNNQSSFIEYLGTVLKTFISALSHVNTSYEELVEIINPTRTLSHAPLTQLEFVFQKTNAIEFSIPDLTITEIELPLNTVKYDLSLCINDNQDQYTCLFEYATDIYNEDFIRRLAASLLTLAEEALTCPAKKIALLNCITKDERDNLYTNLEKSDFIFDNDILFYQFFQDQVLETPHATSVSDNNNSLSYYELLSSSSQLASHLHEEGIAKGAIVALYMGRHNHYLVSMLACISIGAIFVPFNPKLGLSKNISNLAFVDPSIILTDADLSINNTPIAKSKYIRIDQFRYDHKRIITIETEISLRDPAYMIFTSGSTGEPKAAIVTQRGMINHLRSKKEILKLTKLDSIAQIATQTFDVSIWQFLLPLITGSKTVIFEHDTAWLPNLFLSKLEHEKITIFETVPSHLLVILDELKSRNKVTDLSSIRCVISNGEPVKTELAQRTLVAFNNSNFINSYGPTECSDDVTHYITTKETLPKNKEVPLGKPIPNIQILLLDNDLQRVPIGTVGEIYITGECIGMGYYHNNQGTNESFLKLSITNNKAQRFYKTGDYAKYSGSGELIYLGRKDSQIKIRGIRIELAEIEFCLLNHQNIDKCVVIDTKNTDSLTTLTAYICSSTHPFPSEKSIIAYCKKTLPDYMLPHHIILLDEFPLLENGKLNKKLLPKPFRKHNLHNKISEAPKTHTQKLLLKIWHNVLQIQEITINDNFFQLGGHSLLAIKLLNEINKQCIEQISIKILFQNPTIKLLAQYITYNTRISK